MRRGCARWCQRGLQGPAPDAAELAAVALGSALPHGARPQASGGAVEEAAELAPSGVDLLRQARQSGDQARVAEVLRELAQRLGEAGDGELVALLAEFRRSGAPAEVWAAAQEAAARRAPVLSPRHSAQVAFALAFGVGPPSAGGAGGSSNRRSGFAGRPHSSGLRGSGHSGREGQEELWSRLSARVFGQDASLVDIASAAVAFAHVRHSDASFFCSVVNRLVEATAADPAAVSADAVSQLASALSRLPGALPAAEALAFWEAVSQVVIAHVQDPMARRHYTARHMANLAAGLSHAQAVGAAAPAAAAAAVAELLLREDRALLRGLGDRGLALVARFLTGAPATDTCAGVPPGEDAYRALLEEACGRAPGLLAADVALLLAAAARRSGSAGTEAAEPPEWCRRAVDALAERLAGELRAGRASAQDAANSLDALGRLRCRHEEVLHAMAEFVPLRVGEFGPRDTVGVAVAYGRLREADEPTLYVLSEQACRDLGRHSLAELVALATAFARLRVRELRLLEALLERCAGPEAAGELRPGDAVALLSACGRLRVAHPGAFRSAGEALLRRAAWPSAPVQETPEWAVGAQPMLKPADLSEVALAFARARTAHQPLLLAVASACALPGDGPVPNRVASTVLYALCWLRWQHPPLQQRVLASSLAGEGQEDDEAATQIRRWSHVLHAATFLDTAHAGEASNTLWRRACEEAATQLLQVGLDRGLDLAPVPGFRGEPASSGLMGLPLWEDSAEDAELEVEDERDGDRDHALAVVGDSTRPLQGESRPTLRARELLFGALAVATLAAARPGPPLGSAGAAAKALLARALAATISPLQARVPGPGIIFHALALQRCDALAWPAMRPLLEPLLEAACAAGLPQLGQDGSGDMASARWLQERHEPGHKGHQLPKEAHEVGKVLVRIGGHAAEPPLRQLWVVKRASLCVSLLLHAGWVPDA